MDRRYRSGALAYVVALGCFLALDACWLGIMGPRLYRPRIGALMAEQVDWPAAALFYLVYITGLTVLAIAPALRPPHAKAALARGALFGLVAYATYDLTNQATLAGWPWLVTAADLAWGTLASGAAAWATVRIVRGGGRGSRA